MKFFLKTFLIWFQFLCLSFFTTFRLCTFQPSYLLCNLANKPQDDIRNNMSSRDDWKFRQVIRLQIWHIRIKQTWGRPKCAWLQQCEKNKTNTRKLVWSNDNFIFFLIFFFLTKTYSPHLDGWCNTIFLFTSFHSFLFILYSMFSWTVV